VGKILADPAILPGNRNYLAEDLINPSLRIKAKSGSFKLLLPETLK
jgi:hypothetical protein